MSRPLRIFVASAAGLLTENLPNGEGLIAWHLFSALAARGHSLVVCARTVDLNQAPPFEVVTTGRASRWEALEPLARARRAAELFERRGGVAEFDVVHWLFPQDAPLPSLPSSVRFVLGPQSLRWTQSSSRTRPLRPGDLIRPALAPFERAAHERGLERADVVLVSAPAAVADMPTHVRAKVSLLPFGVDLARFGVSLLPPPPAAVLFVGSLERKKGIRDLAEAFAKVAARLPGTRLVVAGDGPERAWLEGRARELGLSGYVEVRGRVDQSAIPELLAAATVVCLPSHGEPFGMAVLEAMAAARAVVAVDEGGPRFLVDRVRGGRLVPRESPNALADALVELLGDRELLERMGRFNRARVEAEFSLDVVADGLERIYRGEAAPSEPVGLGTAVGAPW